MALTCGLIYLQVIIRSPGESTGEKCKHKVPCMGATGKEGESTKRDTAQELLNVETEKHLCECIKGDTDLQR